MRKRLNLGERYKVSSWAFVTGATDGIGKEFCFQLASLGFNIILVSRTLTKLNKVADNIKQNYKNIKTYQIEYDFSKKTSIKEYNEVFSSIPEKFDVSILINNVGADHHDSFKNINMEDIFQEINLNVIPVSYFSKLFFNKLCERNSRSAMINLSSFVADFPFPMKAIYAATKGYDHYITIGLHEEYKGGNIDYSSVKPLEVGTPMTGNEADGVFVLTPTQVVSATLNDLGHESETYGHWTHKIQAYIVNLIPSFIVSAFMRKYWYSLIMKHSSLKKN